MKKLLLLLTALVFTIAPTQAAEPDSYHKDLLDSIKKDVIKANGRTADVEPLRKKKYLFVYRSASWCGPCRQFTPKLVNFYKKNKNNDDFEVLLVSSDNTEKEMLAYMKQDKMPWLGIKFKSDAEKLLRQKYQTRGIPCLFLINEKDEVVAKGGENVTEKYLELKKAEKK